MPGFQPPGAGELSARIVLEKRTMTPDGVDDYTEAFTALATVWARPKTLFGGRTLEGAQTARRASHVFAIRWRADARADAFDHLSFDGRRFRIQSVEDPDERRAWLELLCEELGAA